MALDPTKHPDWQIAQDAEKSMKTVETLAAELGLEKDELLPYGHYMGKIEQQAVLRRLADRPNGKYVDVTAITPTPLGEGKSTTTIGLVQGLSKRGVKTTAAIRQPSGGPTMGMKGSAAGGGLAQCIPLTPYSLNFTGDIHAITSAHNLAMVALTSRMQHERNYDDEKLERLSGMRRLNIDPTRVGMGWAMDFCCQALRNVIIGIEGDGRRNDGFMMRSRFDITAASEIMSIMSLARDLPDLRKRLSRVVLAFDRAGNPVTTADLEVDGAMMAWLLEASKPNLIQTIEGQPVLVHAGPFGNIALGQSSIIADRVALKLSDIHVTESGFGSEIGYEKFWNVKCHMSGLKPDAAVIVATVRALKNHGGAQPPMPGRPLPEPYTREDVGLVEAGCVNLLRHIGIVRRSGVSPVVCINAFATDSKNEIAAIRRICEEAGARVALSEHWLKGGDGALERTAHRDHRQGSLRRRRRGILLAGQAAHQGTAGPSRRRRTGHLHGQDPVLPVRQPRPQGGAHGLAPARARLPVLRRRGPGGAGGRRHQPHARYGFASGLPQCGRGSGIRPGDRPVLGLS